MKILIIEDDASNSHGLRRLIEITWGMADVPLEIVCVTTMEEGLAAAVDANVTILDLGLPDSSILQSIAQIPNFPPPVIVLTGHEDPAVGAKCIAAGAAHVFVKGAIIGFIPTFFKALQQDVVRRAEARTHAPE